MSTTGWLQKYLQHNHRLLIITLFLLMESKNAHYKKAGKKIPKVFRFGTYLLAFFLLFFSWWLSKYFGMPNLEQILYHVSFGSEGLLDTDPVIIIKFLKWCIALPLLFAGIFLFLERTKYPGKTAQGEYGNRTFRLRLWGALPLLLLMMSTGFWLYQVSAGKFITSYFGEDYFSPNYVHPLKTKLQAKQPKNLVLIYVESLEKSYANKDVFGSDLLSGLHALKGASFDQFRQAPGTGWTIAGIVATQCGVPLKSVLIFDGNEQGENLKSFLSSAVCLGDVLEDFGYRNVFMGGASTNFAGKGKFFRDHGYHEIYGREEWQQMGGGKFRMTNWGLHDDDLFANAKKKLDELHRARKPFNLTLLTVDTHQPYGHVSDLCASRGVGEFKGIVKCTVDQVAELVKHMKAKGYLADTNVVVLGDHLAMRNPVADKLSTVPERLIFNSFISLKPQEKSREEILHFDLYPTILSFIGFDVKGNRLGLGYDAFAQSGAQPPADRLSAMHQFLLNRSDTYLSLWKSSQAN